MFLSTSTWVEFHHFNWVHLCARDTINLSPMGCICEELKIMLIWWKCLSVSHFKRSYIAPVYVDSGLPNRDQFIRELKPINIEDSNMHWNWFQHESSNMYVPLFQIPKLLGKIYLLNEFPLPCWIWMVIYNFMK